MTTLEIFEPLLQEFCKTTLPIVIDGNFSTIFLPHTMPAYNQADKKIFYFGRDTYGWLPTSKLMKYYQDNNLSDFINETSKWANNFGFLDYNNNKSSGFWTLALRLHLRIKGITENLTISSNLPDEYYALLSDFGWGNTNAIEVPASLQNQDVWETLDKKKYGQVKEKSKPFDKLVHSIKAFQPDFVFIFNWDCNEVSFLEGLNYQEERLSLINNHFYTYLLPDTNTQVIWTLHPTAARWQGYGTNDIIDEILEYLGTETQLIKRQQI